VVLLTESKELFLKIESSSRRLQLQKMWIILIKKFIAIYHSKDIKDFGLIPEIGRLPVLTHMSFR
jgi:ATP-dependent protease Clp ATPase subunit